VIFAAATTYYVGGKQMIDTRVGQLLNRYRGSGMQIADFGVVVLDGAATSSAAERASAPVRCPSARASTSTRSGPSTPSPTSGRRRAYPLDVNRTAF
jgi:hypothetical protein